MIKSHNVTIKHTLLGFTIFLFFIIFLFGNLTSLDAEVPDQLFDITFTIDETLISSIDDLSGIITFASFGSQPTPVDYKLILLDNNKNEIKVFSGEITVQTENVILTSFEEFKGLNLPNGKYEVIYESVYNVDVKDHFTQVFTIGEVKSEAKSIPMGVVIIFVVIILGLLTYLVLRRKSK